LSIQDKPTITRKYYRERRDMESIGADCRVVKVRHVRRSNGRGDALRKHKAFKPPGKKALTGTPQEIQCVAVGVTESSMQRPKKTKAYYSGKKKRHDIKAQSIVNRNNRRIVGIQQGEGASTIPTAVF
jgi:hypothetical protein